MQRREAAQRNVNQEDSADRPTCNERILRCLSCQSDFLLPKSQTELSAAGQSMTEKQANHASLIKKRQLSQQMSNESRMSRNSKESSGHYSSRTVSLYEDFALDKNAVESAVANKITSLATAGEHDSTQVYLGSPQKQQRRAFEEWKTLNNRSLALEQASRDGAGYFESHLKQLNETPLNERLQTITVNHNDNRYGTTFAITPANRPNSGIRLDGRLAELNTNNLLINQPLNSDKNAVLRHSQDALVAVGGDSFAGDRSDRGERENKNDGHFRDNHLAATHNLSANVSNVSLRNESFAEDARSEHSRNEQSRNDQSRDDQSRDEHSRNDQSRDEHSRNEHSQFGSDQFENDQVKSGVQFKGVDFLSNKPIHQADSQTVDKYLDNLDEFINQQLNSESRNRGYSPTDQIVNTKTENNQMP